MRTLPILLFLAAVATGCATPQADTPAAPAPAEVAATPPAGAAVYVDVRTPEEFAAGHVDGALLLPLDELETRWQELEPYRDRPIRLYCRSGRRSGIAEATLREKGFTNLENVGGFEQLRAAGVSTAP